MFDVGTISYISRVFVFRDKFYSQKCYPKSRIFKANVCHFYHCILIVPIVHILLSSTTYQQTTKYILFYVPGVFVCLFLSLLLPVQTHPVPPPPPPPSPPSVSPFPQDPFLCTLYSMYVHVYVTSLLAAVIQKLTPKTFDEN